MNLSSSPPPFCGISFFFVYCNIDGLMLIGQKIGPSPALSKHREKSSGQSRSHGQNLILNLDLCRVQYKTCNSPPPPHSPHTGGGWSTLHSVPNRWIELHNNSLICGGTWETREQGRASCYIFMLQRRRDYIKTV